MGFFDIPLGHNPFILISDTENVYRMDQWLSLSLIIHNPLGGRALVFQTAVATAKPYTATVKPDLRPAIGRGALFL